MEQVIAHWEQMLRVYQDEYERATVGSAYRFHLAGKMVGIRSMLFDLKVLLSND